MIIGLLIFGTAISVLIGWAIYTDLRDREAAFGFGGTPSAKRDNQPFYYWAYVIVKIVILLLLIYAFMRHSLGD